MILDVLEQHRSTGAQTPLSTSRVGVSVVRRASGASGEEETADDLPPTFDLELAVLLAGFAFESYNQPKGGLRDSDAKDTNTAFMSPFVQEEFAGVLEVKLKSAAGLRKADIIGQSDPYAVLKVGTSAWKSNVKLFTLDPVWNETCRLYVRDIDSQLRIQLYDQDLIGSDDDLGVAFISVKNLCSSDGPVEVELPVQDLGASNGAGGTVSIEARFYPFSARSSSKKEAEAEPELSLQGLGRAFIGGPSWVRPVLATPGLEAGLHGRAFMGAPRAALPEGLRAGLQGLGRAFMGAPGCPPLPGGLRRAFMGAPATAPSGVSGRAFMECAPGRAL
ncbi:hypothetical protein CYMTET_54957 [Cymbomonas tetramitiformis]|uniref:C2 domain-containing protein n=1 Tax=Cymbomonas tetramitiformis TaxID=36881 RepID=A0AAE0EQ71_9CHLO|nr:hypothetical protein CYMTET_54957 [Cymbomonas tetramitiformis]